MTLSTYAAGVQNLYGVAGDNLMIAGSATTTVRIKRISISSSSDTAQTINVNVIKRSSLDTGGTSTTLAAVPYDSLNGVPGATVKCYTIAPAPGTQVGSLMRAAQIFINTAGGTPFATEFDFGADIAQCAILRGVNDCLCLNFGSAPTGSPNIGIDIEWTETPPTGY
jgi:hypothetical protein